MLFALPQATALDTNEKYVEQLKRYLHNFTLRAEIYVEPKTNLDKAIKIIQQVKTRQWSNSRPSVICMWTSPQ